MTRPISGLTNFANLDGNNTAAIGNTISAVNLDGWDFFAQLGATDNGEAIQVQNHSFAETVDVTSQDNQTPTTYLSVTPDDGSTFTLNSIGVVVSGYNQSLFGGSVVLIGYIGNNAVATLTQYVSDIHFFPALVTFNVSGNAAFQGITSFRVEAAPGGTITSLLGLGQINAVFTSLTITTDSGSAAFVAGNNVASTPVAVDSGLTVADTASPTLASATVSITGNFRSGEDVLAFTNNSSTEGNIGASYNATTGILTLTSNGATATVAQWQAALQAVTYTDTAITPNNATRTVAFIVTDGTNTSIASPRSVTVADTDQSPIVTASSGSTAFLFGNNGTPTPVAIDRGITVSDRDNATLSGATISIVGGFQSGEDVLGFTGNPTTEGNIALVGIASNSLYLASVGATATLAQWQAALRAVTYADSAASPHTTTRTVSFSISDGSVYSNAATRTITLAAASPPLVTPSRPATSATPSTPVAIDSAIIVTDVTSPTLASATVSITSNFHSGEDVLGFSNAGLTVDGNIIGSYNATTGVLTLSSSGATATDAQWQAALRAVTYADTSATPTVGARTVAFAVSDGLSTSSVAIDTVTVRSPVAIDTVTIRSPVATLPIYRFFDDRTGEEFITDDVNEENAITNPNSPSYQPQLTQETSGFGAVSAASVAQDPSAVAAYRFFDTATGAHFYTTSTTERDAIMNPASSVYRAGYVYEPNSTIYEDATQRSGDVAVYRLFNSADGTHFMTSNAAEYAGLTTSGSATYQPNLVSEGIAFYAPA